MEILGGNGYGIIEDCGGVSGLERITELCKSRAGQEYEEFAAWSGLVEFDIKQFDCDLMNMSLSETVTAIKLAYEASPDL